MFLNRDAEVEQLATFIRQAEGGRLSAVLAEPDTGLSSALREAGRRISKPAQIIPIDLGNGTSETILIQTLRYVAQRGEDFAKVVLRPIARSKRAGVIPALVNFMPGFGLSLDRLTAIATDQFYPDMSHLEYNRTLCDLYSSLSEQGVTCMVVDHLQRAKPEHLMQLATTLNASPRVKAIAGQNTANCVPSSQLTINVLKPYVGAQQQFAKPDAHLAELILARVAQRKHVEFDLRELPDIGSGLHGFLEQVYVRLTQAASVMLPLEQIHQDILCILRTADSDLSTSVLFHATVNGGLFILDASAFEQEIELLTQYGLLTSVRGASGRRTSVALTSQGRQYADDALREGHQDLVYADILYRSLVEQIETQQLQGGAPATLLYRLSGLVDPEGQKRWRMAMLKSCIATSNFLEATSVLEEIRSNLPRQSDDDTLTLISAMVTTKKYASALDVTSTLAEKSTRTAILKGILLYRDLQLEAAHRSMLVLMPTLSSTEESCILATYIIALGIDRGAQDPLAQAIIADASRFSQTWHYGYLLNVIAATQHPTQAIETCQTAAPVFEANGDIFGLGGTHANIGVHLLKAKRYQDSKRASIKAHELLARFGIQHVHLVANNIAGAALKSGSLDEASVWVRKSLNLLQTSTIGIRALANLAVVEFIRGDFHAMISAVDAAAQRATDQPMEHVRRSFCRSVGPIVAGYGQLPDNVRMLLECSHEKSDTPPANPFFVDAGTQSDRLAYVQAQYTPGTNQYWFPNPMNLFKGKGLSSEAS